MTNREKKQYNRMIARRKAKRAARRAALDAHNAGMPPPYKVVVPGEPNYLNTVTSGFLVSPKEA